MEMVLAGRSLGEDGFMDIPAIQWSTAVEQASWVAERLDPFGTGVVTSVVPGGFAAYARLLHPVETSRGVHDRTVRWAEVAAWSGISLTPQAQFHDIALPERSPTTPAPWNSQGPDEGTLSEHDAAVLVDILQAHTTTPDCCWFCLWDGYGWDTTTYLTFAGDEGTVPDPPGRPDPVPGWLRDGPRVRFPSRDYVLYTGPVTAALAFVEGERQTPNLWWPADRSWCVASEIDLAWTYLAGPRTLIETLLADWRLEACPPSPSTTSTFGCRAGSSRRWSPPLWVCWTPVLRRSSPRVAPCTRGCSVPHGGDVACCTPHTTPPMVSAAAATPPSTTRPMTSCAARSPCT